MSETERFIRVTATGQATARCSTGVVATGANEVHGAQMSASDPSAAEHRAAGDLTVTRRVRAWFEFV